MREDLLHFIWKYKRLQLVDMVTGRNEPVSILDTGTPNDGSGPDFFNAKVIIGGQLWAGNVEIHLKSSDWYAHHHESDTNYNNVILHVVWENDCEVFRSDNTEIPTLELKDYISKNMLDAYQGLFDKRGVSFINCEKDIGYIDGFSMRNWLERLYFERLEDKSRFIEGLLERSHNDWEKVLFNLLLKNFGLKINGDAFFSLAEAIDFSIVRKIGPNTLQLESVFLGMSHLLDHEDLFDDYFLHLRKEYRYLKHKFGLEPESVQKPEFFKLRPPNFPTIRLSQLANLYSKRSNLFSEVLSASSISGLYAILEVSASGYWDDHFTFGKKSKKSSKRITRQFMDLLIINTILPLKLCYAKYLGKNINEELIAIIGHIHKEDNTIARQFGLCKVPVDNAMTSQALLQLYNRYCTQNKCLQCAVGGALLTKKE